MPKNTRLKVCSSLCIFLYVLMAFTSTDYNDKKPGNLSNQSYSIQHEVPLITMPD